MRVIKANRRRAFAKSVGLSQVMPFRLPLLFLSIAFVLFSISFISKDFSRVFRATLLDLIMPVVNVAATPVYVVHDAVDAITNLTSLRSENEALRKENEVLRQWYEKAQVLSVQNERFKNIISYQEDIKLSYVSARVIADTSSDFMHSFILARGEKDGIAKNQAVLSNGKMVGRIVEVSQDIARVLLITDHAARVPVLVQGKDVRAIMAGNNEDMPVLKHLPGNLSLAEGDKVITSGHGGVLPKDLEIGLLVKTDDGWTVQPFMRKEKIYMVQIVSME